MYFIYIYIYIYIYYIYLLCYIIYKKKIIIVFHRKNKLNIKINNIAIKQSTNFKFLGILIDENRNWKIQINNIKNKLYYGLSLLHKYKYKFNINAIFFFFS